MLKGIFLTSFIFFTTLCIAKNYEINVNFESGFVYKSQKEFVNQLQFSKSTREMEHLAIRIGLKTIRLDTNHLRKKYL